jgi:hypothetical protein
MATGFINNTDLYRLYNYVENNLIRFPKDLVIATIKEFFKNDSLYRYVVDEWGFGKVVDNTDLPYTAGLNDNLSTRIFVGEYWRNDVIYYPSILVKSGGARAVPISLNRDQHVVHYSTVKYEDGYGNTKLVQVPERIVLSGAYEGTIGIDVLTRGVRERDDLIELTTILFNDLQWNEMSKSGVSIKPYGISIGSPSESDDRNNKLFRQTLSLDIRTEWSREIPVLSTLDFISFCIDFGNLAPVEPIIAPNLTVSTSVDLFDYLSHL